MIPRWSIGVIINCTGSVAINLGVVLMKLSHKTHKSKELNCDDESSFSNGYVTAETGLIDRRKVNLSRRLSHLSHDLTEEVLKGAGYDGEDFSWNHDCKLKDTWSHILGGYKKYWYLGGFYFLLGTVINFFSMGYAPQSLLSSLGSIQFISNCFFGKLILKEILTRRIIMGTVLILIGNCITLMSSTHDSSAYSKAGLVGFYDPEYQSFLFFELSIAFGMHLLYLHYKLAKGRGTVLCGANTVMPLSYAVCSAIIGTQSAIQGKCLSELINMTVKGDNQFLYPFSFFVIAVWIVSTAFWIIRMNKALALFNGLFIIPTLQVCWTFFSVLGGGIYFNEFHSLSFGRKAIFACGVLSIFYGVFMLAPQSQAELQSRHHSTVSEDSLNCMEVGVEDRPRLVSLSFLPVEVSKDDVRGIETCLHSPSFRLNSTLGSPSGELAESSSYMPLK